MPSGYLSSVLLSVNLTEKYLVNHGSLIAVKILMKFSHSQLIRNGEFVCILIDPNRLY